GKESKQLFERNRARLKCGKWPEKTLRIEEYHLDLKFGDGLLSRWRRVVLIDMPGERLADVEMLAHKDLESWSKAILHEISIEENAGECEKRFLEAAQAASSEEDCAGIAELYFRLMADRLEMNHPYITPSSLLVDRYGKYGPEGFEMPRDRERLVQWMKEEADSGFMNAPVFPIPSRLLNSGHAEWIARNYKNYQQSVVVPALSTLASCSDFLVLVDIAAILEHGPSWKNAYVSLLTSLFDHLSPGGWISKLFIGSAHRGTGGLVGSRLRQVTGVATQIDRIHHDYNNNVENLLKELIKRPTRLHQSDGHFRVNEMIVAAIKCTEGHTTDDGQKFIKFNYQDRTLGKMSDDILAEEVPNSFSGDWEPGSYHFPSPQPVMPADDSVPPNQVNLNKLTKALFNL
ncbi:MAG: YcjX family protein, partial [Pirellulales bacterium]